MSTTRRDSPHEVDFVLEFDRRLVSIEVKSTQRHDSSSGLAAFEKCYAPDRIMQVGEQGIPLEEFLIQPAAYWFE